MTSSLQLLVQLFAASWQKTLQDRRGAAREALLVIADYLIGMEDPRGKWLSFALHPSHRVIGIAPKAELFYGPQVEIDGIIMEEERKTTIYAAHPATGPDSRRTDAGHIVSGVFMSFTTLHAGDMHILFRFDLNEKVDE